jgi:hypothetical protein
MIVASMMQSVSSARWRGVEAVVEVMVGRFYVTLFVRLLSPKGERNMRR